jgi:hypothetical protein
MILASKLSRRQEKDAQNSFFQRSDQFYYFNLLVDAM